MTTITTSSKYWLARNLHKSIDVKKVEFLKNDFPMFLSNSSSISLDLLELSRCSAYFSNRFIRYWVRSWAISQMTKMARGALIKSINICLKFLPLVLSGLNSKPYASVDFRFDGFLAFVFLISFEINPLKKIKKKHINNVIHNDRKIDFYVFFVLLIDGIHLESWLMKANVNTIKTKSRAKTIW